MNLGKILYLIKKNIGTVEKKDFTIKVKVDNKKVNLKSLFLLYILLNRYEDYYFITIENLPFCLMPDAKEHIVYRKEKKGNYYYDEICHNCYLMNTCPGWNEIPNIDRRKISSPKNIPKEIVMEITTKCNLNCRVCTIDKTKSSDVDFATVKEIMKECKFLGIKAVRFTGGEPLLHREVGKMLLYARKNGFYVLLNTNATAVTSSALKLLEKTVDNLLISLQGFNQNSDKRLTNSPTEFSRKITNIIRLNSRIPLVRIGTVISKTLINNLSKYYNLLKKIGINNWELYRPIIKNDKDEEFRISRKDLLKVMSFLLSLKKKRMKVKIANPLPFCISKNINLSLATLLGAIADDGHSRIVWDTEGYFKPSYFIKKNLGRTIEKAWHHPFLEKLRGLNYLPARCKQCRYLKWCKGGSRALAKIIYNSYFHPDPLLISIKKKSHLHS